MKRIKRTKWHGNCYYAEPERGGTSGLQKVIEVFKGKDFIMKREHYKKRVNKTEHEHSGMKNEVIENVISILRRAGKTFTGKRMIIFSSALVCLAAASGYTVGSQVSQPDSMVTATEKQAQKESIAGETRYTLAGGAYILKSNLQKNRHFAEMLGLTFQVKEKKKNVKMTRLLVGTFPIDKERVESKRLEAYTSDGFVIRHGRKFSIYAGSFFDTADARNQKDRLMKQGLNTEEVSVQVEMPLYISYIGDFETAREAMLAGRMAESAGRAMPVIAVK